MAPELEPVAPVKRDWPDTWPGVIGYVLAHPRTWCIVLACLFAWRCWGVKEWYYRASAPITVLENNVANAVEGGSNEDH